jgi:ATP-dependent RNA helicase HelY
MTTPAQRYAQARQRQEESASELHAFRATFPFELDEFQLEACRALEAGRGVLVAAPTGAGKTVVGEFAAFLALGSGAKCFYTTPIKALSNQKYADLVLRHGADKVGLLTGDTAINGEAPIVVMTTEVLRNMLYAGSRSLTQLRFVVMDEVHYLADRFRGAVWEEVIIHLPESVIIASLSATVSNAEEFGDWLQSIRGETDVVVSEHRPVPLWQHVMIGNRLLDLFTDDEQANVNSEILRVSRDAERMVRIHGNRRRGAVDAWTPSRVDVIARLESENLLPAITFIFSRAGCEAAVRQCINAGVRLTDAAERSEIRQHVEARCAGIPQEDLFILGYHDWIDALERGIAAHHAGMLPTFKEIVEELFQRGLVKAVFATETLSLGINMPARSVVLERLVKWNGEAHVDITAGEYTQLTGRAGRRGIDVEGHAVVVWHQGLDPRGVAGLASTRTYPLKSSFRPTYNMAINLVGRFGRAQARTLLESSFAQFQADRGVVGLARQVAKNQEGLAGYTEAMTCHLGEFPEYANLRRTIKEREQELARAGGAARKAEVARSLEALKRGDVILVPTGRRAGLAVVLDPGIGVGFDGLRPSVLTLDRQVVRLSVVDFPTHVEPLGRLKVPATFDPRSPRSRRELAITLKSAGFSSEYRPRKQRSGAADDQLLVDLRQKLRQHPCHQCPEREDHARWAERRDRLEKETRQIRDRVSQRTHVIAKTFDRVCSVLEELGYLEGDEITEAGKRLSRLYAELDLVAAEAIRSDVWARLTAPELAAAVSLLVHESRGDDSLAPRTPGGNAAEAMAEMVTLWSDLRSVEEAHGLTTLREPGLGFAWAAYRWSSGHRLEAVLRDADITAGDFVRTAKQVIDLLEQIATASADQPLADRAREAIARMRRGVVAYSSII